MVAGLNAGSVYSSQYPGFNAGQAMTAQSGGIQAGLDQAAANNTLNVSNFDTSMQTLSDTLQLGQSQEAYNAGGVLPQGSSLGMLNQARLVTKANINQGMQQGLFAANNQNTQANQSINSTRSQLLGNANQYTSGLANADIQQENAQAKLAWGIATLGLSTLLGPLGGAAVNAVQGIAGNSGGSSGGGGTSAPLLTGDDSSGFDPSSFVIPE